MRDRVAGIIVVSIVVLAYAASLPGTFHFDDFPTILRNPSITDADSLARCFVDPAMFSGIKGNGMYRPVLLVTYKLTWAAVGFQPFTWHLTNVLLHALNALLVLLLASRLLRLFRPGRPAGYIPLLAGLIFALHPVHTEVVNYISSRSGAIATCGFLGALLFHLAWTRGGGSALRRSALLLGSLFFLLLGLGGKEIAVAFLPVAASLELLAPGSGGLARRFFRTFVRVAPATLLIVGYLLVRKATLGSTGVDVSDRVFEVSRQVDLYAGGGRSVIENLMTQARVFWIYAGLFIFPVNLAVDHFVRVSTSITEPQVILSLAGIAIVVALLLSAIRRAPLITFCGAVYFFGLAPTSSIVPLNVVMNEHRLYLPGVGIAILAAFGVGILAERRPRAAVAGAVAVGLCWSVLVVSRSLVWQDPLRLWTESVRVSPLSYRNHNSLGFVYLRQAAELGKVPAALPLLDRALYEFKVSGELYPGWHSAYLNQGIAFRDRAQITGDDADYEAALKEFRTFESVSRNKWRARLELAATYGRWKKIEEALERYRAMADEDRESSDTFRNPLYLRPMARLSMESGDYAQAGDLYREIIATREGDLDAWLGLARALQSEGRFEEAVAELRILLGERGGDPEAHLICARFYAGLTPPQTMNARAHFDRAIRLGYRPTPEEFDRYLK